ncbi:hypothetical protein F5I97DRAFT_1916175 [Phlebopus sp. FC_14]|nr:hypothetical protein F5I97DRAFT_1916175 [Phlebopus sp. FC_14]
MRKPRRTFLRWKRNPDRPRKRLRSCRNQDEIKRLKEQGNDTKAEEEPKAELEKEEKEAMDKQRQKEKRDEAQQEKEDVKNRKNEAEIDKETYQSGEEWKRFEVLAHWQVPCTMSLSCTFMYVHQEARAIFFFSPETCTQRVSPELPQTCHRILYSDNLIIVTFHRWLVVVFFRLHHLLVRES